MPVSATSTEAKGKAKKAEQKLQNQQKKIKELAPIVEGLESLAAEYSSRPEEWLPEIGRLESAKFYRDKKIKPLLKEIVDVLHSLYLKYRTISNKYDRLETFLYSLILYLYHVFFLFFVSFLQYIVPIVLPFSPLTSSHLY